MHWRAKTLEMARSVNGFVEYRDIYEVDIWHLNILSKGTENSFMLQSILCVHLHHVTYNKWCVYRMLYA